MNGTDLIALLPLGIPALAAMAVMLAGAAGADRRNLHHLALGGVGLALISLAPAAELAPRAVTPLLRVDGYGLFFLGLLYGATGLLALLARPYFERRCRDTEPFYALLLLAVAGMGTLACADHLVSLFLGLEILTISLYALIGYAREERGSLEAAFKYLILAALSSAFLLFGISLVYAAGGTLELRAAIATVVELAPQVGRGATATWAGAGALLLLVGFGFKLALVPFHMWSPDVYQGAPAPVTAFIATGSKGAVLAVLLRAVGPVINEGTLLPAALAALAVATMFVGNLLALFQRDLKRLLAYSSVAHLGYVLVALAAGGAAGAEAVTFYILVYVVMSLGAFGVVTVLSSESDVEADALHSYRGLGQRRPFLAATLTVMLLALAGIPPTGGFLAKFAVLAAAIAAGRWTLAVAMALASGIAIFYYLRVIVVMYMQEVSPVAEQGSSPRTTREAALPSLHAGSLVALAGLVLLVLATGLYPMPWFRAVGDAVATLFPV